MKEPTRRLIWFQHFHKAGGTSIVKLAMQNDEALFPNNRNGNPFDESGFPIRIWEFSEKQIHSFIDSCKAKSISFIATEFGCPSFDALRERDDTISISLLRDPLKRIISNYEYDIHLGGVRKMPLSTYIRTSHLDHGRPNYYAHMLSMHAGCGFDDAERLRIAKKNLRSIDHVYRLEDEQALPHLCVKLGWQFQPIMANRKPTLAHAAWQAIRMRKLSRFTRRAWLEYIYRRYDYEEAIHDFQQRNHLDQELYNSFKRSGSTSSVLCM
jgi:hypothetical protein